MSSAWENSTLGELFEIGAGKSVTPKSRLTEPRYPFLRTANVFWGRIDLTEVDQMHLTPEELEVKKLQIGDLLVCEGGDIGRAAIWQGGLAECSFQNHLHRLRPRSADVDPAFYRFYLEAGVTMLGLLDGVGNRTTIPNLSRSTLASLAAPKPPLPEQQKIAMVLGKAQEAVEVEGELIRVTRELKQAALRQLFTRGLRREPQKQTALGLVPESWDVVRTEDVCDLSSGGTPDRGNPAFWQGGTIPWVKTGEVNYRTISSTEERITEFGLKNSAAKLLPAGTLVMAMYGQGITRGRVARLGIAATTNQACAAITPRAGARVSIEFLYHYFVFAYEHLRSLGHGANQKNMNLEIIRQVAVPCPSESEQREIAALLETIDAKLAHHEGRQALLRELFRTLLRDLLTARRRVTVLPLDQSDSAGILP